MRIQARMSESAGAKRRIGDLFSIVGLQLLLVLGTLATTELILRVADFRELRDGYRVGSSVVHHYDPELGWSPLPRVAAMYTGSRTIAIHTNSLGLRDIEHDRTPKPTVLFLGDSFVWGYDVEQSERFTELLREELPKTRIVNAGIVGYGTDQEYLLLERIWSAFEPNVVVLMFTAQNDRTDNASNVTDGGHYKPYLVQNSDDEWRFAGQPVPKSRHVYFIENPLVRNLWLARTAVTGYVFLRYPRVKVIDPTERLVGMMRDFVDNKGAAFLVGLQYHEAQLEVFLRRNRPATTIALPAAPQV